MLAIAESSASLLREDTYLDISTVSVLLFGLGGAEFDLGCFERCCTLNDIRTHAQDQFGWAQDGWTMLLGADVLSDDRACLADLCDESVDCIHLTALQDVAPKFVSCTHNACLQNDGAVFKGGNAGYGYAWALVPAGCTSLTVRLGPMCGRGASYFVGVVPEHFLEEPSCEIEKGFIAGVCLYVSGEGRHSGKVKRSDEAHVNTGRRAVFTKPTFEEGELVSLQLDREQGVCRFGRSDCLSNIEWTEQVDAKFVGRLGIGIYSKGHAEICCI